MTYAFENPTLDITGSQSMSDPVNINNWFSTHQGPYTFKVDSGNYIYSPSTYSGATWQSFTKNSGGTPILLRITTGLHHAPLTHFLHSINSLQAPVGTLTSLTFPVTGSFWKYKVESSQSRTLFLESSNAALESATHVVDNLNLDTAVVNDVNITATAFAVIRDSVTIWYSGQDSSILQTGEADVNVNTTVEGDVVQVDGTIDSSSITVTPQAQAILDDIESKCQALSPSTFENLGALSEYKVLVDKALEVKDQTHLLSQTLNGVNMNDVTNMATQIGDCLSNLTFTLQNSVSIDDTSVLTQIQQFVSGFYNLQVQLQRFQIQISVTNNINVPESLNTAVSHLEVCKTTVDEVMQYMKAFVGLSSTVPANKTAMSTERQQQIAESIAALEAIKSLGSEIVSDFENEAIKQVKAVADSINTDTLSCLTDVKNALDSMTWIKAPGNSVTGSSTVNFA